MVPGLTIFSSAAYLIFTIFGHAVDGGITMNITWPKTILAGLMNSEVNPNKAVPPLEKAVEDARREWLVAQNYYNSVSDKDLVDHAVYLMQAAEKKYVYLLKKARSEGVINSPYS